MRDPAGASIVSMFDRRLLSGDPRLARLEAYWSRLRGGEHIPYRADIEPGAVSGSLQFAFVLERVAPTVATIRIAGMHLSDIARADVKGMPFGQMFDPSARAEAMRLLGRVFDRPARLHMKLASDGAFGRREGVAELILMPLRDDFGLVTAAFGGLVSETNSSPKPCRFSVREWRSLPVHSALRTSEDPARAMAAKISGHPAGHDKPHLRLVSSSGRPGIY